MTPADQRHVDRSVTGRQLILDALGMAGGQGSLTLAGLAEKVRFYGPQGFTQTNENDTQVWAAMLRCEGRIVAVSRTGPVRYALAGRAS